MLLFLKDNAMLLSGLCSAVLTVVFAFTHLTVAQTSVLVGVPSAVGNTFAHVVIRAYDNNHKTNGGAK